jgi:hypothetical protein
VALAVPSILLGQGVQSGTLQGNVKLQGGEPGAGVTVTASSPALQGERSTVTNDAGDYVLRGLPPGDYKVSFTLGGMKAQEMQVTVPYATTARADAQMTSEPMTETIVVTADAAEITTSTVGENLGAKMVDELAIPRDPVNIALLAPGVKTGQLNGQVEISGGIAYDNLFLLNGADFNDSVFGNPNNLFIEDAIQETQVLTSGISAEYGRFGGGVVNAITKSGGNEFHFTLRDDRTNPKWRSRTPLERDQGTKLTSSNDDTFTGTLGGFIVRDRLWFFVAGRSEKTTTQQTLFLTGTPYPNQNDDKRIEGKLTLNLADNHSVQLSYLNNRTKAFRPELVDISSTTDTLVHDEQPQDFRVLHYSGVLTSSLFVEGQYSQKKFEFKNAGGTSHNIVDSPFICATLGCAFNAPYFDATDPEERNNKQIAASVSYLLTGGKVGSHDIKFGGEQFKNLRTGGNSQSPTNYVFFTDPRTDANGNVVLDSQGHAIPVFTPGFSFSTFLVFWDAHRGSRFESRSNALYVNDNWRLNDKVAFTVGARYEDARNTGTDGITTIRSKRLLPRLGATVDPLGNGKYRIDASYARYAGSYNLALFTNGTNTGNPGYLYGPYIGPAGQGRDFAAGFNPDNYLLVLAGSPTQNVSFARGAKAPLTTEYALGAGMQLRHGSLRLTYQQRRTNELLEAFQTIDLGTTQIVIRGVPGPQADNIVYRNSNLSERTYKALVLQGRYAIKPRWSLEGNWTHELENDGGYEGQGGQGIGTSGRGIKPEFFSIARNSPDGRLTGFQADVLHIWSIYDLPLGRAGDLAVSLLGNYFSPLTYSLTASNVALTDQQVTRDPGYAQVPGTQTLYFGKRGSQQYNAWTTLDFASTYSIPIYKGLSPWLKFQVLNVLNDHTLIGFNHTVRPNLVGPTDSLGLPTTFTKDPKFGKARSNNDFPDPREYRISVGVRF